MSHDTPPPGTLAHDIGELRAACLGLLRSLATPGPIATLAVVWLLIVAVYIAGEVMGVQWPAWMDGGVRLRYLREDGA